MKIQFKKLLLDHTIFSKMSKASKINCHRRFILYIFFFTTIFQHMCSLQLEPHPIWHSILFYIMKYDSRLYSRQYAKREENAYIHTFLIHFNHQTEASRNENKFDWKMYFYCAKIMVCNCLFSVFDYFSTLKVQRHLWNILKIIFGIPLISKNNLLFKFIF